uniref:Putative ticsk ixostatin n=1 Tax=Ixodes ricinus TaxID=34613 RepID=A0A147BWD0_IXORI
MQLTTFMIIIGFTHLLCEAQTDSTWYVDTNMNNMSGECKNKLLDEVEDKCLRTSHGSAWVEFNGCSFVCEKMDTKSGTAEKVRVTVNLKNDIPCGPDGQTCQDGKCVKKCDVDFVS